MLVVVRNLRSLREHSAEIGGLVRRLEPVEGPLRGVWCEPDSDLLPEGKVAIRCAPGVYRSLRFEHSFELADVWAIWRFEPADGEGQALRQPSHLALAGALLSRDGTGRQSLFVPVFAAGANPRQVTRDMDRLPAAYPQRIGAPLYRHGDTGRLSWALMAGAA